MSKPTLRERLGRFFFVMGVAPRHMRAWLALVRDFQARGFIESDSARLLPRR
ncbi:MAG: hypothetical protein ABUS57_17920 [Pseudomonadota bacterium]